MPKNPKLEITWPLYDDGPAQQLPADPTQELRAYAPPSADLAALYDRTDFPDPGDQARARARQLRESLPPTAPDWMRAARYLIGSLQVMIDRGTVSPVEYSAIARAWAAWSLGGVSEAHVLRVAHLVQRAHAAVREAPATTEAYRAAAGVLHNGLPVVIKSRLPFDRVLGVIKALRREPDAWGAVVEGTAELLGWKHYGRVHAASVIRAVIERDRANGSA